MVTKPVFEAADLDALIHLCETARLEDPDLPGPPYHLYERTVPSGHSWYEAYVLPLRGEDLEDLERVGTIT